MTSNMYYPTFSGVPVHSNNLPTSFHQRSGSMDPGLFVPTNGFGCHPGNPPYNSHQQPQNDNYYQPRHRQSNSFCLPPPGLSYLQQPAPLVSSAPLYPQGNGYQMLPSHPMGMNHTQAPVPPQQNNLPLEKDTNVNGGVCEVLDYDLNTMSDFVTKNACLSFGNFEVPSDVVELFSSSVSSVLGSTRLPSVTLFLALDYLIKYLDLIDCNFQSIGGKSVDVIYQNLIIAFILANKFNDDKTFTNKSWSQATGMELMTINQFEKVWLNVFNWRLFEDKFDRYESFQESYHAFVREQSVTLYQQQLQQQQSQRISPSPIMGHHRQYSSASSMAYGYQTPNLGQTSMAFSSPIYSDMRNDSYNAMYNKHMPFSPLHQLSPSLNHFDNLKQFEKPQQPFWNDQHRQLLNKDYYCFSVY